MIKEVKVEDEYGREPVGGGGTMSVLGGTAKGEEEFPDRVGAFVFVVESPSPAFEWSRSVRSLMYRLLSVMVSCWICGRGRESSSSSPPNPSILDDLDRLESPTILSPYIAV